MYNSYTSLQREQLAKQTYTDTQSTYLLVYAPLRSRVLAQALQDQLHRKFRLVDHLAGELTDAVAGVLLVSEDVACLSTTLTYFAQALRDGADYAVCNAVFGFSGQTALYQSHGHLAREQVRSRQPQPAWPAAAPPRGTPKASPSCWLWPRSSARPRSASRRPCSTTSGTSVPRMPIPPPASGPSS